MPPLVYNTYDQNEDSIVDTHVRGLFSATAPLAYNSGSGGFSITQSGAATDGYLSSVDWNTFNNKQNALTFPIPVADGGTGLTTWTAANRLIYSTAATTLATLAASANAALTADASGVPTWVTAGTPNRLLALRAGGISWGRIAIATDFNPSAAGDILYGSGGAGYNSLAYTAGTPGNVLLGNNPAAPSWGKVRLADPNSAVTGILPTTSGGTEQNSTATGTLLVGAGPVWSNLSVTNTSALRSSSTGVVSWANGSTANRLLRTDGTTVSFAQVVLTTDVSGILPVANGGSGSSSAFTAGSVVFAGASGVYSEDNANLFFDNTNNLLMVGANTPFNDAFGDARLTVSGRLAAGTIHLPLTNAGVSAGCIIQNGSVVFHTFGTGSGSGNNLFLGTPSFRAGNFSTTGIGGNVGVGANCLTALTSGTRNMGLGGSCMQNLTSGVNNCLMGEASGFGLTTGEDNAGLGQNACRAITTGKYNVFLGSGAGYDNGAGQATPGTAQNSGGIGYYAQVSGSNMFCLGSLFSGFEWNVGINLFTPTARLHLPAGVAAANSAPFKLTSGTNQTTAEAGAMEYNGTNLFFTRTGTTRENVCVGNAGATAPATNAIGILVDYFGTSATRSLNTPNDWLSVVLNGTTYKIPLYT